MIGPTNYFDASSSSPATSVAPSHSPSSSATTSSHPVPIDLSPVSSISDLMKKIDLILASQSMSRNQKKPQDSFNISMHFKRPTPGSDTVLLNTWKSEKMEDNKPITTLFYSVPMEVEIDFPNKRDVESIKFQFLFKTGIAVPDSPPYDPMINGKYVKNLLPATTAGARKQAMYKAFLHANMLRRVIKASMNSHDPQYDKAKLKVEILARTDKYIFSALPHIQDSNERFEKAYKLLKDRKLDKVGFGGPDDQDLFFVDFSKRAAKTSKVLGVTFASATQKLSRVPLALESGDQSLKISETVSKLIPDPNNPEAFKEILDKEDINPTNLLTHWPDNIEADYEHFLEKSKAFMKSSQSTSRLGGLRNLFVRLFIRSKGTSKLRKLKSEIENYEKDLLRNCFDPASKKIPRSRLGKLKQKKDRLARDIGEQEMERINQFRLDVLNSKREWEEEEEPLTLDDLKNHPSYLTAFDKEWDETLPTLGAAKRKEWEELLESTNMKGFKQAEKEFNDLKKLLLTSYGEFASDLEELRQLNNSITSRLDWLQTHIPEDHWSALDDENRVKKNLIRIIKRTSIVPKRLHKIESIFKPKQGTIKSIEDAT